jgi:hypothetical protein
LGLGSVFDPLGVSAAPSTACEASRQARAKATKVYLGALFIGECPLANRFTMLGFLGSGNYVAAALNCSSFEPAGKWRERRLDDEGACLLGRPSIYFDWKG